MSRFLKKIAAITAAIALISQIAMPVVSSAEAKTQDVRPKTATAVSIPETLKTRMKIQKDVLRMSGKLEEYSNARIKWDDASAKPNQIRGLNKKASKNIAADVSSVLSDLAPLYGTQRAGKKSKIETKDEVVDATNGGKHVRLEQSFS